MLRAAFRTAAVPRAVPRAVLQAVPRAVPQAVPRAVPWAVLQAVPRAVPQGVPRAVPRAVLRETGLTIRTKSPLRLSRLQRRLRRRQQPGLPTPPRLLRRLQRPPRFLRKRPKPPRRMLQRPQRRMPCQAVLWVVTVQMSRRRMVQKLLWGMLQQWRLWVRPLLHTNLGTKLLSIPKHSPPPKHPPPPNMLPL